MMSNNSNNTTNNGTTACPSFSDDPVGYIRYFTTNTNTNNNNGVGAVNNNHCGGFGGAWRSNHHNRDHYLAALAGHVAACMKEQTDPTVAALYLQAAARQLASALLENPNHHGAAAATNNNNKKNKQQQQQQAVLDAESELKSTQQINEVYAAIGHCAARCSHPRSAITKSGILAVLGHLQPEHSDVIHASASSGSGGAHHQLASLQTPALTAVRVEFLQTCVFAEQYHYAARYCPPSLWPRPTSSKDSASSTANAGGGGGATTTSVKLVLRYYYLRGVIHMGCQDWNMAVRCFWTCLSVPADVCSAIALNAWKKLVLVQCILAADDPNSIRPDGVSVAQVAAQGPLALPRAAPPCYGRFFHQAAQQQQQQQQQQASKQQQQQQQHDQPEVMHMAEAGGEPEHHRQPPHQQQQQLQQGGGNNSNQYPPFWGVKIYVDLVHAFVKADRAAYDSVLEENLAVLIQDGNLGICKQCQTQLMRRQVVHFSRLYAAISLEQLSLHLQLSSAATRALLIRLSAESAWNITISPPAATGETPDGDTMVRFPKWRPRYDHQKADVEELMELTRLVQKLDTAVAATPKYASFRKDAPSDASKGAGPRGVEDV